MRFIIILSLVWQRLFMFIMFGDGAVFMNLMMVQNISSIKELSVSWSGKSINILW